MNKKIIAMAILAITLAMTVPAFATPEVQDPCVGGVCPTQSTFQNTGSAKPVVEAKWETPDDHPEKAWTQVDPIMTFNGTKRMTYWVIVTDSDGVYDIDSASVDVYHPDGSKKYELKLNEVPICAVDGSINTGNLNLVLTALGLADSGSSVKYSDAYTLMGTNIEHPDKNVTHDLVKCSAKAFKLDIDISECQMCGEFTWELRCDKAPPCTATWHLVSPLTGYRVDAFAFDKEGLKSDNVTNYFEYMCSNGVELDFNSLNFQNVLYKTDKWIEGDDTWQTPLGPACKAPADGCRAPSIRNIGNIPAWIKVTQDDMGFGYSETTEGKDWNVAWDYRLGENAITAGVDPFTTVTLDGTLGLCQMTEIGFSIFIKKPMTTGTYRGNVTIDSIPWPDYPYFPGD